MKKAAERAEDRSRETEIRRQKPGDRRQNDRSAHLGLIFFLK